MLDSSGHFTLLYFHPETHKPIYKRKKTFEKEKDAIIACMELNIKDNSFKKMVPYKCKVCGKWHIGHNKTTLDKEEKEKIKIKLDRIKKGLLKL